MSAVYSSPFSRVQISVRSSEDINSIHQILSSIFSFFGGHTKFHTRTGGS
jgi:hypothetical protein